MLNAIGNAMAVAKSVVEVLCYSTANEFGPGISTGHENPLVNSPTVLQESASHLAKKSLVSSVEAENIRRIV